MEILDLQTFLSTKKILNHLASNGEFNDALMFLIQNQHNANIITYENARQFVISNIMVFEKDNNGNYYYQFPVKRDGDLVDNIRFESMNLKANLTFYIGGIKYEQEEFNEFVIISSQFNEFEIRVNFHEKPSPNDEFKILSRYYLCNPEERRLLCTCQVVTKNNVYCKGFCSKL